MIRVQIFPCDVPRAICDELNHESGQIYTRTLVTHYRLYRKKDLWLSESAGKRLEDYLGGKTTLHAHSRDAAQEGFYVACKVAKAQKQAGMDARYPHKRKWYRTTTWKNTGMLIAGDTIQLKRARGIPFLVVSLPEHLRTYPVTAYRQMELVYNKAARSYEWHLTIEDGTLPSEKPGTNAAAIDLGEIHPVAITDGQETAIFYNKPKGRIYRCAKCGFVGHRDGVGSCQILSRHRYGKLSQIISPKDVKYRYPARRGKRSPRDQGQVAVSAMARNRGNPEASAGR